MNIRPISRAIPPLLALLLLTLSACKNGDSSPTKPVLHSIKIDGLVFAGNSLKATYDCTRCNSDKVTYTWLIGATEIGKQQTVILGKTLLGETLKLIVTPINSASVGGESQSITKPIIHLVTGIYESAGGTYAALKTDGSVIAWGDEANGGKIPAGTDASGVAGIHSVAHIHSTGFGFTAVKTDGAVIAWGLSVPD